MENRNKQSTALHPSPTYFGLPDAARENRDILLRDHVYRDIELQLKTGDKTEGYAVIVGIKGSGKTALRRFVEFNDNGAATWVIDADHNLLNLDPAILTGRSGVLKNLLALEILREFTNNLRETELLRKLKKSSSETLEKLSE